MRVLASVLIALAAAGVGTRDVLAQADQPPVFRSGVEVMEVDVTVVDGKGTPVRDLRAPEFAVTVDGQPRRVVSAEFIGESGTSDGRPAAPRDPYVSNNTDRRAGRLIMIVVDRNNMDTTVLRSSAAALTSFVKSLAPDDRLALATIPPPGPFIEFTTNHAQIVEAIPRIVGHDDPMATRFNVSPYEAFAFETGLNPVVVQRLLFRVCGDMDPNTMSPCDRDVEQEARTVAAYYRQETTESVAALGSLLRNLADVPGPKSLLIMSQGLMIDGSHADATALATMAAESRVNINVLMYTPPVMSASQQFASETPNQDRDLREAGLETLASRSRGTLFRVAANPQYVFDRVRSEISAHYMLGVEPIERDRDGRAHQIRVEVKRSGVQVRARRQVKYTVRTPNTWSRDVLMGRVLRSPSSSTELPMRVSTYTFRDETPGKVKVIVAAEISPESMEKELDVAVGYAIFDELGKAVVGGQERKIYSANSDLPLRYEIALGVDPGQYRLRIAAIDLAGKSGSVERDVAAFGMGNHEFALGDLILSTARQGKGGEVRAPVILRIGDGRLATFTEFYTNKPGALDDTDVRFEIAASEDGAALQTTLAQLSERTDKTLRQATSVMPVGALPPGRYFARAVFTRGSKTVGKLTRPFEVLGTGLSTAAPPDSPGAKVDATGERSAVRDTGLQVGVKLSAFKKEDALTGDTLRATFDVIDKNHPAVKAATARARTGKIEGTAMLALDAGEQSAGSILRGIELLQKGQLDPAANQFNVALRTPADAPLASFFLGVCYAAVGRDKEAVAAWERARAAQLSVPSLHSLLASGLLRLGQPAQALEPLRISLEREPQNDDIRRNLAIAQSFVGLQSDALSTITPFLDRNPSDADALLVALHALYQLRVDGKSAGSAADDTARAASYARAYGAAKGPHGALVDKWVEFMQQPR